MSSAASDDDTPKKGEIVKMGYLKKLKTMKKKYFVLRAATPSLSPCLEYYDSAKKWKNNMPAKRIIPLKTCFSINRRTDTKHDYVIALFTRTDCFSVVLDNEEELDYWLKALLITLQDEDLPDGVMPRPHYEHVWRVSVQKKELASKFSLSGPHLLCLTDSTLTLVKPPADEGGEPTEWEFPLHTIRRCGSLDAFFYMELGQASCLGAGNLWMEAGDSIIANNMHNVILHACTSCPKKDMLPKSRSRSSSANEASRPSYWGRKWPYGSCEETASLVAPPRSFSVRGYNQLVTCDVSTSAVTQTCNMSLHNNSSNSSIVHTAARPFHRRHSVSVGDGVHHHNTSNTLSVPFSSPYLPIRRASTGTRPPVATSLNTMASLLPPGRPNTPYVGRERCDSLPTRPRTSLDHCAHNRPIPHGMPMYGGGIRPMTMFGRNQGYSQATSSIPTSPLSGVCSADSASSLSMDGDGGSWETDMNFPVANPTEDHYTRTIFEEVHINGYTQFVPARYQQLNNAHNSMQEEKKSSSMTEPCPCRRSSKTGIYNSSSNSQSSCSPCSSSPLESGFVLPGSDGVYGNRNHYSLNRSYDSMNHSRESSIHEEIPEEYMTMMPKSLDTGYMSEHAPTHGDLSPGLSNCSITSCTPSADSSRHSDYHFDRMTNYLTPADEDIYFNLRPTRAYSTGSTPDTPRTVATARSNNNNGLRMRAFSVGSRSSNSAGGIVVPPSTPSRAVESTSVSSVEQEVEIDLSNNRTRHRGVYSRSRLPTTSQNFTAADTVDASPRSSPKSNLGGYECRVTSPPDIGPSPRSGKHPGGFRSHIKTTTAGSTSGGYTKASPPSTSYLSHHPLESVVETPSVESQCCSCGKVDDNFAPYMDMKPLGKKLPCDDDCGAYTGPVIVKPAFPTVSAFAPQKTTSSSDTKKGKADQSKANNNNEEDISPYTVLNPIAIENLVSIDDEEIDTYAILHNKMKNASKGIHCETLSEEPSDYLLMQPGMMTSTSSTSTVVAKKEKALDVDTDDSGKGDSTSVDTDITAADNNSNKSVGMEDSSGSVSRKTSTEGQNPLPLPLSEAESNYVETGPAQTEKESEKETCSTSNPSSAESSPVSCKEWKRHDVADETAIDKERKLTRQSSEPIVIQLQQQQPQNKSKRLSSGFFKKLSSAASTSGGSSSSKEAAVPEKAVAASTGSPTSTKSSFLNFSFPGSFASLGRKSKKNKKDKTPAGNVLPTPSMDYDPSSKCAVDVSNGVLRLIDCDGNENGSQSHSRLQRALTNPENVSKKSQSSTSSCHQPPTSVASSSQVQSPPSRNEASRIIPATRTTEVSRPVESQSSITRASNKNESQKKKKKKKKEEPKPSTSQANTTQTSSARSYANSSRSSEPGPQQSAGSQLSSSFNSWIRSEPFPSGGVRENTIRVRIAPEPEPASVSVSNQSSRGARVVNSTVFFSHLPHYNYAVEQVFDSEEPMSHSHLERYFNFSVANGFDTPPAPNRELLRRLNNPMFRPTGGVDPGGFVFLTPRIPGDPLEQVMTYKEMRRTYQNDHSMRDVLERVRQNRTIANRTEGTEFNSRTVLTRTVLNPRRFEEILSRHLRTIAEPPTLEEIFFPNRATRREIRCREYYDCKCDEHTAIDPLLTKSYFMDYVISNNLPPSRLQELWIEEMPEEDVSEFDGDESPSPREDQVDNQGRLQILRRQVTDFFTGEFAKVKNPPSSDVLQNTKNHIPPTSNAFANLPNVFENPDMRVSMLLDERGNVFYNPRSEYCQDVLGLPPDPVPRIRATGFPSAASNRLPPRPINRRAQAAAANNNTDRVPDATANAGITTTTTEDSESSSDYVVWHGPSSSGSTQSVSSVIERDVNILNSSTRGEDVTYATLDLKPTNSKENKKKSADKAKKSKCSKKSNKKSSSSSSSSKDQSEYATINFDKSSSSSSKPDKE